MLKGVYTDGDYFWKSDHLVTDCGAGRSCGRTAGQEAYTFWHRGGHGCRLSRHCAGGGSPALAHCWRAVPEWGTTDHLYPRSGGARGALERFCLSPCLWLLLPAWQLCAQASPVLVGDLVPR